MTLKTQHTRKNHRVYRSPSKNDPDNVSSYAKRSSNVIVNKEKENSKVEDDSTGTMMMIDAEDKEASTILMALAEHAHRLRNSYNYHQSDAINDNHKENLKRKDHSMSIKTLLDNGTTSQYKAHCSSLLSLTGGISKISYFESKRKGYQICLTQRNSSNKPIYRNIKNEDNKKSIFQYPATINTLITDYSVLQPKRNTMHIRISYHIHAHKCSLLLSHSTAPPYNYSQYEASETKQHPYPSAFRLIHAPYDNTNDKPSME
ncbi:uncharacterized protein BX663DRAFT_492899 [Cokeromyces recurvatus]|uniref:uncharacterized protein n=1 Tax=Cokeromyces recurvatus TaxID=90255 RepID=UPI00221F1FCF|nr:uncharacterized protein BX663DRAFT_492899 [Cokeromyces recurvatus]KAI7908074.1 hypothetical protein BX663DRAFT_492899 [Cokeromyces recurvatus]